MKKILLSFLFFLISGCSNIDFVYKENKNLTNPLYEKTNVSITGHEISFMNSYGPMFFGNNIEDVFSLSINIEQSKTKSSVETNQATSKLRYKLKFIYTLKLIQEECAIFKKEVLSYFTVIPKSSGYNFGTDTSLEKKYELAIIDNLNRFVSILSDVNINDC